MIDTLKFFDELKETLEPKAAKKIAELMGNLYTELSNTVTKAEFRELTETVRELAEAQKRTEQRLTRLETIVEELAEAQKRTELEVMELARGIKETRQMIGNLSDTVGYGLEDRAMKELPQLFRKRYNIEVDGKLVRKFVKYNGRHDEINIFGKGEKENRKLYIIGEAKSRLSKKHIDDLIKLVKRLEDNGVISGDRFLFMVTYSATPDAEEYAKDKSVEVIWSFEV